MNAERSAKTPRQPEGVQIKIHALESYRLVQGTQLLVLLSSC